MKIRKSSSFWPRIECTKAQYRWIRWYCYDLAGRTGNGCEIRKTSSHVPRKILPRPNAFVTWEMYWENYLEQTFTWQTRGTLRREPTGDHYDSDKRTHLFSDYNSEVYYSLIMENSLIFIKSTFCEYFKPNSHFATKSTNPLNEPSRSYSKSTFFVQHLNRYFPILCFIFSLPCLSRIRLPREVVHA